MLTQRAQAKDSLVWIGSATTEFSSGGIVPVVTWEARRGRKDKRGLQ